MQVLHQELPRNHISISTKTGFTVVEVVIVLAIATGFFLMVFMAIPALQRANRNDLRDKDAMLIAAAIRECLTNAHQTYSSCDTPEEIPISVDQLNFYTGFHFGAAGLGPEGYAIKIPPTNDEPNWLFGLHCTPGNTWFEETQLTEFVVTYFRETAQGIQSRCLDG